MVDESGQLFTIEGFAAALVIVLTTILVLNTTIVYSPPDVHIPEMQLRQLGSDALAMMDTPEELGGESELNEYIVNWNETGFKSSFSDYIKNSETPYLDPTKYPHGIDEEIQFNATIFYRDEDEIMEYPFIDSGSEYIAREPAVRVSRWIFIQDWSSLPDEFDDREQVVLLEVMLWRG